MLERIAESIATVLGAAPEKSESAILPTGAERTVLASDKGFPTAFLSQPEEVNTMSAIVIDPGHGGTTNLECSSWNNAYGLVHGTLEKDLTLDVALRVERELQNLGLTDVHLTRRTDVNVGGRDRARLANSTNAAVLVSIHFNGSDGHDAQGTETFMHRDNSITGPSAHLCRALQASVLRATGLRDRNALHPPHFAKLAGWCVINPRDHAANTASVLTEVSFLDRPNEEKRLLRESYRDEIAFAIAEGIHTYVTPDTEPDRLVEEATEDLEDAVSQAAFEAGVTVEEMMGRGAPAPNRSRTPSAERGGHAIASPDSVPALQSNPSLNDIARLLSAPIVGADKERDERGEGEFIHGDDAPDFSDFGKDPEADVETMSQSFGPNLAALQLFNHPAFADKVRSWNLRYFQPIELLVMGGKHNTPGHKCYAMNSLPPVHLWDRMEATIKMLDEIRHRHGAPIRINSAYRNEAYNKCVGGKSSSLHKVFNAIDFTSSSGSVADWFKLAIKVRAENPAYSGGIGDYPTRNFVHIDTRGTNVNF